MEQKLCEGCPTNPPCAYCPTRNMRVGVPKGVAVRAVKRVRPPLDREKMGFGKHDWEYIDPESIPTDFQPPEGGPRREFNNAFNRPHPETNVDLDVISRPGAVISTTAPGLEGEWEVVDVPRFRDGVVMAALSRGDEVQWVSTVALGVVAERSSNMYEDSVITKRVSGGKANRTTREALTKKSEEAY